jgi:hypothetical protein
MRKCYTLWHIVHKGWEGWKSMSTHTYTEDQLVV